MKKKFIIYEKLINLLIKCGKKKKALNIFFSAFKFIKIKTRKNPNLILKIAIKNLKPAIGMRKVYIAGQSKLMPALISKIIAIKLALKWLIKGARDRLQNKPFFEKLAIEIYEASFDKGYSNKYKKQWYLSILKNRSNTANE